MLKSSNCPFGNAAEAEGQERIGDAQHTAKFDP
jgi:hypothetical protein